MIEVAMDPGENSLDDTEKWFEENDKTGTINLRASFTVKKGEHKGTIKNDEIFDSAESKQIKSYEFQKGSDHESAVVDIQLDNWAELEKYLKGENLIQVKDSDIVLEKPEGYLGVVYVYYRYMVDIDLVYVGAEGTKEYQLTPKGKKTDIKISDDETYASARAKISAKWPNDIPDGDDDEESEEFEEVFVAYASEIEDPFVEIKEGTPGNETFEAMAGVPTVNNLYVGFGATEFAMNMEATFKENPEVTRTYTLTYTVPNWTL